MTNLRKDQGKHALQVKYFYNIFSHYSSYCYRREHILRLFEVLDSRFNQIHEKLGITKEFWKMWAIKLCFKYWFCHISVV